MVIANILGLALIAGINAISVFFVREIVRNFLGLRS